MHLNFIHTFLFLWLISGCSSAPKKQTEPALTINEDLVAKYHLNNIKLPPGYAISVFAEVDDARSMTISPSGTVFVGTRNKKVYAVTDANKDGVADRVYTIANDLNSPNGVAFKDGSLYIATISAVLRLDNIEQRLTNPPNPVEIFNKFPTDKHHGWKFIAFGPDGKLYVPVGAPCNICESKNPVYASITRMNADGSNMEIFASGIRNTVGFTWHPQTKQLWFTDNGRDNLGNNVPGDELNTAPQANMHFGYPYCHQGNITDPEFGSGKDCKNYTPPVQVLGPHVASLGIRFSAPNSFGNAYPGTVFIAEHGSWNRNEPIGYRISMVGVDENGKSKGYSTFAEGWLQPGGKVSGRPVDLLWLQDGSMLVSDDYSNVIYRIYKK